MEVLLEKTPDYYYFFLLGIAAGQESGVWKEGRKEGTKEGRREVKEEIEGRK